MSFFDLFGKKPGAASVRKYAEEANIYFAAVFERPAPKPIQAEMTEEPKEDYSYSSEGGKESAREEEDAHRPQFSLKGQGDDLYYALLAKTYEPEVIDRLMKSLDEVTDAQGIKSALSETEELSFVDAVRLLIGQSGRTEAEVYKAAGLDRRLFSKIMKDPSYKPSKDTAVCLALALRLPLSQANDLLSRAGYTLSHSIRRDIVIEYFFRKRVYDLMTVNLTLDRLTLRTLGR